MINHLKSHHDIVAPQITGVPSLRSVAINFSFSLGQKKISAAFAKRATADVAICQLTAKEMCCTLWATRALPFDLIDDPLFRAQFGVQVPIGLNRNTFGAEMKEFAHKVNTQIFKSMKGCMVTLGVDGWTNSRHR